MEMKTGSGRGITIYDPEKLSQAWAARQNIMKSLFSVSRLMFEDEKRLQVFHNEIARIVNVCYDNVKIEFEKTEKIPGYDLEKVLFIKYFGSEETLIEGRCDPKHNNLISRLNELTEFVYGYDNKNPHKIGFISRALDIVQLYIINHYHVDIFDTDELKQKKYAFIHQEG